MAAAQGAQVRGETARAERALEAVEVLGGRLGRDERVGLRARQQPRRPVARGLDGHERLVEGPLRPRPVEAPDRPAHARGRGGPQRRRVGQQRRSRQERAALTNELPPRPLHVPSLAGASSWPGAAAGVNRRLPTCRPRSTVHATALRRCVGPESMCIPDPGHRSTARPRRLAGTAGIAHDSSGRCLARRGHAPNDPLPVARALGDGASHGAIMNGADHDQAGAGRARAIPGRSRSLRSLSASALRAPSPRTGR